MILIWINIHQKKIRGMRKRTNEFEMIDFVFSDDGGSDSSADDGLPKHLEVIAAAKVTLNFNESSIEMMNRFD